MDAYQIYVDELEDIAGIVAVQYAPYHGGLGDVYWFKNKKGIEIPVVTATYTLWKDLKMIGSRSFPGKMDGRKIIGRYNYCFDRRTDLALANGTQS
jgi:hypothetical protein